MRNLITPEIAKAVHAMHKTEHPLREVAELMGVSRSWVGRVLKNYSADGLLLVPKKRKKRERKLTLPDEEIIEFYSANENASLRSLARFLGVSSATLHRRLEELGLRKSNGRPAPNRLSASHRDERVSWCLYKREQLRENPGLFDRTVFTDETQFNLFDGRVMGWSLGKERTDNFDPASNQGGILVWGALSRAGPICIAVLEERMTGKLYQKVFTENVLPFLDVHGRDMQFQQKGRTAFTSGVMKRYFYDEGINVIPWPRSSSDLNPIHDIWRLMEKYMQTIRKPRTLGELCETVPEAWRAVCTPEICRTLYAAIPQWIENVVEKRGSCRLKRFDPTLGVVSLEAGGAVVTAVKNDPPAKPKKPKPVKTPAKKTRPRKPRVFYGLSKINLELSGAVESRVPDSISLGLDPLSEVRKRINKRAGKAFTTAPTKKRKLSETRKKLRPALPGLTEYVEAETPEAKRKGRKVADEPEKLPSVLPSWTDDVEPVAESVDLTDNPGPLEARRNGRRISVESDQQPLGLLCATVDMEPAAESMDFIDSCGSFDVVTAWGEAVVREVRELPELRQLDVMKQIGEILYRVKSEAPQAHLPTSND